MIGREAFIRVEPFFLEWNLKSVEGKLFIRVVFRMAVITITGLPQTVKKRELRSILSFIDGFQYLELDQRFEYPLCHAVFNTSEDAKNAQIRLQGMVLETHSVLHIDMGRVNPYENSLAMHHYIGLGQDAPIKYARDISGNDATLYRGAILQSGNQLRQTSFLVCRSRDESVDLQNFLLSNRNDYIVGFKSRVCHEDENEWLVAIDAGQTAFTFFVRKMQDWFSMGDPTIPEKMSWFSYIKSDLTRFLSDAAKIWTEFLVHPEYTSVFTHDLRSSLFLTDDQKMKVLPVMRTRWTGEKSDIDNLNHFFRHIICLPFQVDTDINRMIIEYNLNINLGSYLHFLCEPNLQTMGSRMLLLGHPFMWIDYQKSRFIVRLDEMIKSNWIDKYNFFLTLENLHNHPLRGWKALVVRDNDAILVGALNHPTAKYPVTGDVIRFCSNLYRHCNDATRHSTDRGFDLIEIEMKITRAIPHLYLSLFEGLLRHGIRQPGGEDGFFTLLYDQLFS
ncbi:hypothetical protein V6N12_064002 [Hibiscus sabdariffa]|uniref:RRM domain-containing protein n=1 Tax=Hibiscus sabdariffa TaxID=183260 RepID=A0ABR2A959_9ROSI